jgi:hypothetical protein
VLPRFPTRRHGVHSAVESKSSCPVLVTATLILDLPAPPASNPHLHPEPKLRYALLVPREFVLLCGRGTGGALVRATDPPRQTATWLAWETQKRSHTVELHLLWRPLLGRRPHRRRTLVVMRNHRDARDSDEAKARNKTIILLAASFRAALGTRACRYSR